MSAVALALHEATDDRALDAAMSRALRVLVGGPVAWTVLLADPEGVGAACWRSPCDATALDDGQGTVASVLFGAPGWVSSEPLPTRLSGTELPVHAALPLDYRQQAFGALLVHAPVRSRSEEALRALSADFARALANQQRFQGARQAHEHLRGRLDGVMRATRLLAVTDVETMLAQLLALLLEVSGAEVGCLILDEGEPLEWGLRATEAQAMRVDGHSLVERGRRGAISALLPGEPTRCCAAVPLQGADALGGCVVLASSRPLLCELPVLTAVSSVASMALTALQAQHASQAQVRADALLALAAEHQRTLLGQPRTRVPGATVVARTLPCEETGGDLHSCIPLTDGRLAAAVGDVVGHGVAATLHLSSALGALRALLPVIGAPAGVLAQMDGPVATSVGQDRFMTLFLGIYDPESGVLDYASAGHDPAWVLRSDAPPELLGATGVPLGGLGGGGWEEGRVVLGPGDRLVVASDGLTEATGLGGPFTRERLAAHLVELHVLPVEEVLEGTLRTVRGFCSGRAPQDDWTLLILERPCP